LLAAAAFLMGMSVQQMGNPDLQATRNLSLAVGLVLLSGLVGVRQKQSDQQEAQRQERMERLESRIERILSPSLSTDSAVLDRVPDPSHQFVSSVRGSRQEKHARRGPWVS